MPSISLLTPTAVARTGSTIGWTGLGDDLPATSGAYDQGDKSEYVQFQILPSAPLVSLPATLSLTISTTRTEPSTGTQIIDDVVQLGDVTAPAGTNYASLADCYDALRVYNLSTAGLDLGDFNAGDVYLWVGYKAIPESAFDSSDWDISISPSSPNQANALGTVSLTTDFEVTVEYVGVGQAPDSVPLEVESFTRAFGNNAPGPTNYTGTASTNNGIGGADSGPIEAPAIGSDPSERTTDSTITTVVPLTAGVGTYEVSPSSSISISPGTQKAWITHELTPAVENTDPSTMTLISASIADTEDAPSSGDDFNSSMNGVFGRIPSYGLRTL